jgi:exopolysaccharide production protein ExoZ
MLKLLLVGAPEFCPPARELPISKGVGAGKLAPGGKSSLEGIQILRAVAALLVVLSHTLFESRAAVMGPKSPDWLVAFGSVGVDIFFVISGFIMFYMSFPADRPSVSPSSFMRKRLTRIYPLYLFCLALALALWSQGLVPSVVPDVNMLVRSILLFPSNYFIIGVSWTLVYEMYFYLVFATTLYFARPLVSLFGTSAAILIFYMLSGLVPDKALGNFLGNPIAAEFCLGLLLAYLSRRPRIVDAARLFWIPGLALLVIAPLIAPYASTHFPANPARLLWGVPSFLIVASFLALSPSGASSRRLMLLLGDASYAIYLTHPMTLICYTLLLRGSLANIPQWPIVPVVVAVCAGCGVLVHVFVERRFIEGVAVSLAEIRLRPSKVRRSVELHGSPGDSEGTVELALWGSATHACRSRCRGTSEYWIRSRTSRRMDRKLGRKRRLSGRTRRELSNAAPICPAQRRREAVARAVLQRHRPVSARHRRSARRKTGS